MADPITWGVIGALALTGASTGYQINAANGAEEQQDAALREQKEATDKALADQKKQAADAKKEQSELAAQSAAQAAARSSRSASKRRPLEAGSAGRSSTILTSPLGEVGQLSGGGKTLLGQ